jgi:adenylyl- and sulfurtransferase ThiI
MISVLLRYQELALKGKNRPWFQRHLIRNLHRALAGLGVEQIRVPMGRSVSVMDFVMEVEDKYNIDIPLNLLSETRTLQELAAVVEQRISGS